MPADEQLQLGIKTAQFDANVEKSTKVIKNFKGALGELINVMVTQDGKAVSLIQTFKDVAGTIRQLETESTVTKKGAVKTTSELKTVVSSLSNELKTQAKEQKALEKEWQKAIKAMEAYKQALEDLKTTQAQRSNKRATQNADELDDDRIRKLRANIQSRLNAEVAEGKARSLRQSAGPASSPNDLTPELARGKQLVSLLNEAENDRTRNLRENIQQRFAAQDANEKDEKRRLRDAYRRSLAYEKFQNAPFLKIDNIRRRAASLFEVVTVFRAMDAAVQGFVTGLKNAVDVSVRIGEIQTIDRAATSYDKS
jgi:chromosome segregation ATPase